MIALNECLEIDTSKTAQDTIELNDISHHFDSASERIELFRSLSYTIRADETLAIIGPSGAGKSSLLSIAAGLEMPAGGKVCFTIDGVEVDALTMRANSGFIFQQFHLMPELDAIGNLALPLRLKGNRDAFDIAAIWLEKVGLKDRARHRPHQLSGGNNSALPWRALLLPPRVLSSRMSPPAIWICTHPKALPGLCLTAPARQVAAW